MPRPAKPRKERRTRVCVTVLNEEEFRTLRLALDGESMSEYLRIAMLERAARGGRSDG